MLRWVVHFCSLIGACCGFLNIFVMYLDWCIVYLYSFKFGGAIGPQWSPLCVAAHHIPPGYTGGWVTPRMLILQCPAGVHRHQSACGDDRSLLLCAVQQLSRPVPVSNACERHVTVWWWGCQFVLCLDRGTCAAPVC